MANIANPHVQLNSLQRPLRDLRRGGGKVCASADTHTYASGQAVTPRQRTPNQATSHCPRWILMWDQDRHDAVRRAVHVLPRGAAIIVRHKDTSTLESLARSLMPMARRQHVKVLIANDWRLALRLKADGLHLSEHQARRHAPKRVIRPKGFCITAAAHSEQAVRFAIRAGVDGILLSPIFPTISHPAARPLGHLWATGLTYRVRQPLIALGGITHNTRKRLTHSGFYGIAAIGLWIENPS